MNTSHRINNHKRRIRKLGARLVVELQAETPHGNRISRVNKSIEYRQEQVLALGGTL
jgi:hypothetical protein